MIASRKNSSPARWKAHSFARWLVLCVFLAAATNGRALANLHAPTSTSELAAGEREAAIQYNFASNYNEQTDPELANALALTSGILGLVDLGASFSGVKNLASSTNKASDALQLINKSETSVSLNHSERVAALVNKLEQGTHPDVVATLSSVKAREFVEDVLEIDRSAAQKAGKTDVVEQLDDALDVVNRSGEFVKDVITKRVLKTISKYDKNLGQIVDYPMYNNVALGKSTGGSLKRFGDEVGANVWTKETDNIFTSMYDLMESRSFERNISDVFNQTLGTNQGKILFDVTGVNVQKAITGGMVHNPILVLDGFVTELELQLLMRNKTWYDNVIFHEGGKILNTQELTIKGIKYLGQ